MKMLGGGAIITITVGKKVAGHRPVAFQLLTALYIHC